MSSIDIFYNVASICIFAVTVFISWAAYSAVKTLNKVDEVLLDVTDFTSGIKTFKKEVKMRVVSAISALANKFRVKKYLKGGENL